MMSWTRDRHQARPHRASQPRREGAPEAGQSIAGMRHAWSQQTRGVRDRPRAWQRYGFGLLIAGLALAAAFLLDSRLSQTPAPILFVAVTLAAWYGGLGPALLSTLICALGLDIFIEEPIGQPNSDGSSLLYLGVFVLAAVLVSSLNERRRRAETEARNEAFRMAVLAEASQTFVAAAPAPLATLQVVARHTGKALGDGCVISLVSEDGRWLSHPAWHHRDPVAHELMGELYAGQRHAVDEGVSGQALRQGRPFMIAARDPAEVHALIKAEYAPLLERFPIYSLLSIPLRARRRPIGTLTVWRCVPDRPFSPGDLVLLQELADRSAMTIDSAQLSLYYQALFQQIPEPAVVLDVDRRLLDANPAAAHLLGYTRESLRGCRIDDIAVGDTESLAKEFAELRRRGSWRGELNLRREDGTSVPVDASIDTVQLLTGPVYIWVWHDLTEQRALQEMRNQFIAAASHELRTPLTAALAALGLIQQPESGDLQPAHRELANNAMRNIQRLRILVDDLLADGQIQAGALVLNRQPLDLRGIVTGAVETVYPLLRRKGQHVALDMPDSLPVYGDAHRLEQVFVNLLANAHQHTPRGTRIEIIGRAGSRDVCVSVSDDGPGIPDEYLNTIFERFSRAETGGSGTGLGLAITRDLVASHGGRIWAEHSAGRGAAFQITVPRAHDGGE